MVEVTSLVDYVIIRLKNAVYEDWKESRVLLRKCIRQGSVAFKDLREVFDRSDRFLSFISSIYPLYWITSCER